MRAEFWEWFDGYAIPRLATASPTMNRTKTFRAMFEHLDKEFQRPVTVVETGCIQDPENWAGNGCSTILFNNYCAARADGSKLYSVDIDPVSVGVARQFTTAKFTTVAERDSVAQLRDWAETLRDVDLVYLDGSNLYWENEMPSANHHLNELYAIMPALHGGTLVAVDDSPPMSDDYPRYFIGGKGMLVAQHARNVAADVVFSEYQVGWTKMTNKPTGETDDVRELVRRAREHVDAGRWAMADAIYRTVLIVTGRPPLKGIKVVARAEACAFFGQVAFDKQKWGFALDWYRDALTADPSDVDSRLAMIRVMRKLGMDEACVHEAQRATRIAPEDYRTWKALGDSQSSLADHYKEIRDLAIPTVIHAYEKEGELAPADYHDWKLDRCSIAVDTEDYGLASKLARELIGTKVEADGWHVLGMVHYRLGEHEEAIACFDKAIAMKARDQAQVHWNRSLPLHALGRYREGWKEHEWRAIAGHNIAIGLPMRRFVLPRWTGQKPPAVIHVHGEAGAGDNIACSRYLKLMRDAGYTVRYECLGAMEKMFQDSFPDVEVVERAKDYPGVLGIRPFDYHAPIGSLPAVFATDIDTVPWFGPYIKADPELVAAVAAKMSGTKSLPRIGLCWSSGIRLNEGVWMEKYGRKKSMSFEQLVPLITSRYDVIFYNLQVGPERAESHSILDVLPAKPTWAETAAVVANLDLVITVDTGIAHLAGAMGKPVWILMHTEGSWHFMVARPGSPWNERSPWYPSARIFRAEKPGKWAPVVERVAAELGKPELRAAAE